MDKTTTRSTLSEAVFKNVGLSRNESATLVDSVFGEILKSLIEGNDVKISSFGTFVVRQKKERIGRNPKTGDPLKVPVRRIPVFRAGKRLKNSLNIPQVKSCGLVDVQKVKVIFSKVMDETSDLLMNKESYDVLVDERSVGPITDVEVCSRSSISRQGEDVEGINGIILTCSGSLRGKRLEVIFRKELLDIDGNYVELD